MHVVFSLLLMSVNLKFTITFNSILLKKLNIFSPKMKHNPAFLYEVLVHLNCFMYKYYSKIYRNLAFWCNSQKSFAKKFIHIFSTSSNIKIFATVLYDLEKNFNNHFQKISKFVP